MWRAAVPNGRILCAHMRDSQGYATAGPEFPATPITAADVMSAYIAAGATDVSVVEIPFPVRDGHDGVIFVSARRAKPTLDPEQVIADVSVEV